tara:strand:+ start:974 stop:1369 length:396 start_codon:yes stop_codon:yes gene_type:complete
MSLITKILIASSLILNSFLLIYLFGLIPFLLFLSVIFNLGFVSYIGFLLTDRNNLQADFFDLLESLEAYSTKLLKTYELEMFYGDQTLEDLILSSKALVNTFYDYEDKYFFSEEEGTNLNDREEETEESTT